MAEVEKSNGQRASEDPEKQDLKASKKKEQKSRDDGMYLPVLVEFTFTSSVIILVLVFLVIAVVSWRTGASLLDFVLHTSVAIGVLGGLLMFVSQQVSMGVLKASVAVIEEKLQESKNESSDIPTSSENLGSFDTLDNLGASENQKFSVVTED